MSINKTNADRPKEEILLFIKNMIESGNAKQKRLLDDQLRNLIEKVGIKVLISVDGVEESEESMSLVIKELERLEEKSVEIQIQLFINSVKTAGVEKYLEIFLKDNPDLVDYKVS